MRLDFMQTHACMCHLFIFIFNFFPCDIYGIDYNNSKSCWSVCFICKCMEVPATSNSGVWIWRDSSKRSLAVGL